MDLVIGYVRYSSHAQDDGNSIAAQISTIEKYAADHNMEVEEFFIDTAKTGRNTNRPHYQEMKRKIESGELASKTIIVRALDRLHRNAKNQLDDLEWFDRHDIRLIAVNDGTDTKSHDFSKLALTVKAAVAEEFSDTLAKNTKAALNEVAKQCKHTGGLPPIGYRVNEIGLYEIDETTAPIVRLIYKLYLQDMGYDYISKELKKQGYKTAEGNDFSKTSIHSILTNEKYMGTYTYDKTASKDSSGKRNSNAHKQNYIRIQNGMPAIISSADFEKVKKKLAENAGRQGSRTTKHYYALNGVMKCPECGHAFTGNINNSNGRKYPQYRQSCKCGVKSVNMDKMNNFTFHALQQCVFSPDNKDKIIERINAKIGRDMVVQSDEINALKNKINKLQDAQNKLMDYLQSGMAPDSILERIQKNENELKQLRNQLDIKSKEIALVDDEAYTRLVKKFKSYMGSVKSPEAKALRDGHKNPLPLPNLECNIVCGNSLIDQINGVKLADKSKLLNNIAAGDMLSMFSSSFDSIIEKLLKTQDELFRCDVTIKKEELKAKIQSYKDELIKKHLTDSQLTEKIPQIIADYENAISKTSKPFVVWEIDFARVFRDNGGFDIVIGNPPYIQLQKTIDEENGIKLGDLYQDLKMKTFAKTGDIYCLFYKKDIIFFVIMVYYHSSQVISGGVQVMENS